MSRFILLAVAVSLIPAGAAAADPKWLCLADASTGFYWNGVRWGQTSFATDRKRYVISKDDSSSHYAMKTLGSEYETQCGAANEHGFMACDVTFGQFIFNSRHLRYVMTYPVGFVDGKDNNDNTPSIEIGSCSVF